MSSAASRYNEFVDQSAAVAAAEITAVKSIWGAGSNLVDDPLRTGFKVQPWLAGSVPVPGTHVSLPFTGVAPEGGGLGMTGMTVYRWTIPMRFYLDRSNLQNTVQQAALVAISYFTAFAKHVTLHGTCRDAYLTGGFVGGNDDTAWLDWTLTVSERLTLVQSA